MIRARYLWLVLALAGCKMGEDTLLRDVFSDTPKVLLTVDATSATEGEPLFFTAKLSHAARETVSVNWATSAGTATAGDDYIAASGTISFAPGETVKTFIVATVEDDFAEYDEIVRIVLSGGSGYDSGSTVLAAGKIIDDDALPAVLITDASVTEGDSATFTVSLTEAQSTAVSVDYSVDDGTATAADNDFTAASDTIVFAPGETSKTITVATTSDGHYEADESFTVTLSGGAGYTTSGSDLAGMGTIANDDPVPTISISDESEDEGTALEFTVALSHRSYQTVTLNYATSNGTATLADSDYTANSGVLSFAPGELSKTVTVATGNDTKYENDETLTVTLSGGSNYTAVGSDLSGAGTIKNDDAVPQISIDDVTASEGGSLVFTVTQDRASAFTTTFNYASSGGTATSGSDFTATSGSGSITAGDTSTTISVPLLEDTAEETDESFTMSLSNAANAAISDAIGTGTIVDTALLLNFMTGTLPGGVTFTRASAGTYVNATGRIVSAAAHAARFDHDPATLALRGLLVEPTATNLLVRSAEFNDAAWTASGLRAITANNGDTESPDGVNSNGELLRENATNSAHNITQNIGTAITPGSLLHFTVYVKNYQAAPRDTFRIYLGDLTNGDYIRAYYDLSGVNPPLAETGGTGSGAVASLEDAGNGWKRVRLSGVASTVDTNLRVRIHLQQSFMGNVTYQGDNTSGIQVWGAQLEAGNLPTSYIPTAGTTASRAPDVVRVTSFTGFTGGFGDGTNWTMITDFSRPRFESAAISAAPRIAELCDSADCLGDRISTRFSTSGETFGTESVINAATQGGSLTGAVPGVANTVYQLGAVKTAGVVRTYMNGTAYTASGSIAYPDPDSLYLGSSGYTGSELGGHLRKFTFRARSVPGARMLTFTSD